MTDKAISPLRRRMIEDMTIRKFAPRTQASYIRSVKNFAAFLGRSPDTASAEDLRRYQLHLEQFQVAWNRSRFFALMAADPRVRACAGAPDDRRAAVAA